MVDGVGRRFELTMAGLHHRIDSRQVDDQRAVFKTTLDGVMVEQAMILKLPIWPWRLQTISSVGATFLLAMMIWVIQHLLQRLGI